MTLTQLFIWNASALMLVGLFGILTRKNIIKILLSINILQTGVNLLLVALGYMKDGNAPLITQDLSSVQFFVDPLPQALVLTSIVIGFGTTAVGLVVAIKYYQSHKTLDVHSFGNRPGNKDEEEVIE